MEQIPPGINPRDVLPGHRERGPKRFKYTYDSVASLVGRSALTVARALRGGGLDAVTAYVARSFVSRSRLLTDDELRAHWGKDFERWCDRWPRLPLYRCGWPGCVQVLLGTIGLCDRHGGGRGAWAFGKHLHFMVRLVGERGLATWVPYHRLVLGVVGLDTHHADFNRWNNRPENLVAITSEEHRHLHFGGQA